MEKLKKKRNLKNQ